MALYLAVKQLGLEADHSSLSSASFNIEALEDEPLFGSMLGIIERSTNRCIGCI
jgi:hypothetical protein